MPREIRNFLNGLAFGVTETVPGVSGGTIAIILGFYDELIHAVNHFTEDMRKYLRFLIPLAIGVASGVLLFSSLISYLLTNHSFPTMFFFIGLIVGIIPLIFSKVKEPGKSFKLSEILMILIPVVLLIIISNIRPASQASPEELINNVDIPFMLFIFFAGIIAAAALVIPGISGSFVLLLLGIYHLITYSVSSIRLLFLDIGNVTLWLNICKVLLPLAIGVAIGGLSMARLIEKLLRDYYKIMYSIILGLLLGSVYVLINEPIVFQSGVSTAAVVTGIVTFSLGALMSYTLGKKRL